MPLKILTRKVRTSLPSFPPYILCKDSAGFNFGVHRILQRLHCYWCIGISNIMLLGYPGCLRFLGLLVCVKNVLVLFLVAKRNNFEEQFFIRYINKESKLFPHNVPGFTMEIKTIVAMGVAETWRACCEQCPFVFFISQGRPRLGFLSQWKEIWKSGERIWDRIWKTVSTDQLKGSLFSTGGKYLEWSLAGKYRSKGVYKLF